MPGLSASTVFSKLDTAAELIEYFDIADVLLISFQRNA
jgi:hypothetical protein